MPIKTVDTQAAFSAIVRANAQAAAGNNTVVAKNERANLDPYLLKLDDRLRAEQGKHGRVTVDKLEVRAERELQQALAPLQATSVADAKSVSKEEVAQVAKADPELGAMLQVAYAKAARLVPGRAGDAERVKGYFEKFDFASNRLGRSVDFLKGLGVELDARAQWGDREHIPAPVLGAFDYYYQAEAHDIGSVVLRRMTIAGQDIYTLYTTTDGDKKFLEIYDSTGLPLASARINAERLLGWDPYFGHARQSTFFVQAAEHTGDKPLPDGWVPELVLDAGKITHENGVMRGFDTVIPMTSEQLQLAWAGLEVQWDRVIGMRVLGPDPVELGMQNHSGVLRLGRYTDPQTGTSYKVADWKDVDDDSRTLFFTPGQAGTLALTLDQYNN